MSRGDLVRASAGVFLLHPVVEGFFSWELPRLLRHLRSVNDRKLVDDRRVDGHVHWPATLEARGRGGPGRFVVRRAVRRYDLPENQLLLRLLHHVERGLQDLPQALRTADCHAGLTGARAPAVQRLSRLNAGLARARRDPRLTGVRQPLSVDAVALRRARDTGMPAYAALADAAELSRALLERPSAAALRAASAELVLMPQGDGDLLWARLALGLSGA